jgi:hypothetical protein
VSHISLITEGENDSPMAAASPTARTKVSATSRGRLGEKRPEAKIPERRSAPEALKKNTTFATLSLEGQVWQAYKETERGS